jgi:hypothetical protein
MDALSLAPTNTSVLGARQPIARLAQNEELRCTSNEARNNRVQPSVRAG